MTEKTFDEKMRELDKRIERDQKSIDRSLFNLAMHYLKDFRYTNNGTAG